MPLQGFHQGPCCHVKLCIVSMCNTTSTCEAALQYRSSLIGRAMTRSLTSLGVRARVRLGFTAGYDVFRMYAVLVSTNQIRALKITPG